MSPSLSRFDRRPSACSCADVRLLVDGRWSGCCLGARSRRAGLRDRRRSWSGRYASLRSQARLVVLDVRELEFMDSSGVHALVSHAVRARQAAGAGAPAWPSSRRPHVGAGRASADRRDRRHRSGRVGRRGARAARRPGGRLMSATAPRGAAEMVPIEHETLERVVRTLVFGVPPVALAVGGLAGVGRNPALAGPGRAGDHLHAHRARHHGRLSPAVHPPQLQDHAHGAGAAGRARLDGGRGPGDRVGRHAPQAPPLLRPARATRTARTSTMRRVARRAARTRPRARRLDVPRQGHGQPRAATPRTCSPTATCASSAARSRSGWWSGWPSRSASAWR